ncbi:MAG: hypothetical protein P1U56_06330 [Saprospiraceae bacterium]|nr:hypothetical protein [Saprospiraceae bacterium]
MELLRSIVILYDQVFSNESADAILFQLNDLEKEAFEIILKTEEHIINKDLKINLAKKLYNTTANNPTFRSFLAGLTKKMVRVSSMSKSKGSDIQKIRFEIQVEKGSSIQN